MANSRKFTREDYTSLRNKFDGSDAIFDGMGIVAPRCRQTRTRSEEEYASFLYNDKGTQEFLLKNFPLLETNEQQRDQAGRWAIVIYRYFRRGDTDSLIEVQMGWEKGTVGSLVQQIRRKIKGLRRNGKPYSTRKRGRPPKIGITAVQPLGELNSSHPQTIEFVTPAAPVLRVSTPVAACEWVAV